MNTTLNHKNPNNPTLNHTHRFSTRILAEIIIFVSLAASLSLISHSFFSLPQGGSINIGMIPILWLALRRGWKIGIFGGALFGMVDLAITPFVVHPIQLILDYPLPFAALGLAGLFQKYPIVGVAIGGMGRFVCHLISGVVLLSRICSRRDERNSLLSNIQRNVPHTKHNSLRNSDRNITKKQSTQHLHVDLKLFFFCLKTRVIR